MTHDLSAVTRGRPFLAATDTVPGLCAFMEDAEAVAAIYALKRRELHKPLALLAASFEDIADHVEWNARADAALRESAPGSITFVVRRSAYSMNAMPYINPGLPSIGVRFPAPSPVAALLSEAKRPIVATSANLSGTPHAATIGAASLIFHDIPVATGECVAGSGTPSCVMDFTDPKPRILRP